MVIRSSSLEDGLKTGFDKTVEPYLMVYHNCPDKKYDASPLCVKLPDTQRPVLDSVEYFVHLPNTTSTTGCSSLYN
ncbi:hypothetical protein PENTCL1PPCAC_25695 [Pristionchus entomophagus]|uniref:Uncharacterized protein n=1 Tax=Pristionchus entomophagus TaxID=358040 RepID=A0AAV5U9G6_9BILA|nr:hypothetical protein PENTCL1PPCAC_25695 [Pristionchus entomophagus]